jgi:hypothetical protein
MVVGWLGGLVGGWVAGLGCWVELVSTDAPSYGGARWYTIGWYRCVGNYVGPPLTEQLTGSITN